MIKKLYNAYLGEDLSIQDRLFRIILLVGTLTVSIAMLQSFILQNSGKILYITYCVMLLVFVISFLLTFKYGNSKVATILIGIVIIIYGCPQVFFYGGGARSGAAIWMSLGLFYIFVMFKGLVQAIFLICTVITYLGTFIAAYQIPGLVVPLASESEVYFDIMFALLTVSTAIGLIFMFYMRVYDKERRINLEQKKELERIGKSKDIFFASMSHEIRTPINAIVGLNELILRQNPSDEIQGYSENIQNASKMLLSLINDILDLSQLEIRKTELVEEEYSTQEMLQEVVDMMKSRMSDKQLQFNVEIDRQLPSKLYGDERRIEQILLNILSNAVKYTQKGSVTFMCQLEKEEDDIATIKISVADTGCGIRKEELEFLFDAFKRADKLRNHRVEGTGLGLAITKQLVDLMDGTITVDSIYTQGSVFTVTLKQKIIEHQTIGEMVFKAGYNKKQQYNRLFEAPEARILVVDDDDLNLIVTTKLLQDTKVTIDTASRGEECLRRTRQRYYNLILMDYMMPDMDGEEVLHEIRKQENGLCRDVPVILLSANSVSKMQVEYKDSGFDSFLEKPLNAEKLEEEILKFIPDDLVEYRRDGKVINQTGNIVSQLLSQKRKRIYITSDCACDIPQHLLEKFDIRIIYLYIKTQQGRYQDTKEIDVSNLANYLSETDSMAFADSATIEEYEKFFAETLTEAEDVIHISVAKNSGKSYEIAMEAARGFDHVHVLDSGHISGGQGLIVLKAAQMAIDGASMSEIFREIERLKEKIDTQFLIPFVDIFYRNGYTDAITAHLCKLLHVHPVVKMRHSKITIMGTRWGNMESAWKKFLHFHLDKYRRYDNAIIFITYAGCTVKQQEYILQEVRKCADFAEIIVSPTCVSNACNAGLGTVGYSVYRP